MENNKMTIFYRKRNGQISNITTQEIGFEFYGELEEDYKLTHDFITIDYDKDVVFNSQLFEIDNNKLVLKNRKLFEKYI